ncbi:MAG: hypothetical protein JHC95_01320 [Solirubrobacteraceae bacterium]|nr:hypothetical protein [Solirubrobacteraceae bacterium]
MAKQSVTIGVQFTTPVTAKLEQSALDDLIAALDGGGWHNLPVEDGTLRLNLSQVVYVKTDKDEPRIGFN